MSRELTEAYKNDLEAMIDSTSLSAVLQALSEIARDKAEHINHAWQDTSLASVWEHAAKKIEKANSLIAEI